MIGTVVRVQVPMMMTFDEDEAAFVIEVLANALERSYQIVDMFPEYYGEEEEF